jgi:DNA-binding CsgD family transcriptional regulator
MPMLVADDQRRYVNVNRAMCLLLRLDREAVLQRRVEDLTPPELHGDIEKLWGEFLRAGIQGGTYELLMPDGPRMRVEYSATANVEPSRHLSIFEVPPTRNHISTDVDERQLTVREREVLALVAMGDSGATIARVLKISPATVESHVRNSLSKLGARNRPHAIALALRRGELSMDLGTLKR